MHWLSWLFDTRGFHAGGPGGVGWTPALRLALVLSNSALALVCYLAAVLLVAFLPRHEGRSPILRDARLALLFALGGLGLGTTFTIRALSWWLPVYHLHVLLNCLTASTLGFAVAVMTPVTLARRRDAEERDALASAARMTATAERIAGSLVAQEQRMLEQSLVADVRMRLLDRLLEDAKGGGCG